MTKFGVWTCKDIRTHLDATPLTDEQKVAFIDQNLNSSKGLRAYINKQRFGFKEMKFMGDAGPGRMTSGADDEREADRGAVGNAIIFSS